MQPLTRAMASHLETRVDSGGKLQNDRIYLYNLLTQINKKLGELQ